MRTCNAMFASGTVCMVVFAVLPEGPPRLIGASMVDTRPRRAGTWVNVAAGLLPVAMATAVVLTANHYLLDVAAGADRATPNVQPALATSVPSP